MEHDDPLRRSESTAEADVRSPVPDVNVAPARGDNWFRVAALAGAATLPLVLIASTLADVSGSGGLNPGSSDAQLVGVFSEFRDKFLVSSALFGMAAVAMLAFLGPLWVRLRAASEAMGVVAVGGGVAVAVILVGWATWCLAAAVAADYGDADAARFIMVSGWEAARVSVSPYLVMVGATTVAGYRHGVFGRLFNAGGLVFTALLILGLFPASPAGLMGMLATLWVVVAAFVVAFGTTPLSRAGRAGSGRLDASTDP
jgi:hypothetical protein